MKVVNLLLDRIVGLYSALMLAFARSVAFAVALVFVVAIAEGKEGAVMQMVCRFVEVLPFAVALDSCDSPDWLALQALLLLPVLLVVVDYR